MIEWDMMSQEERDDVIRYHPIINLVKMTGIILIALAVWVAFVLIWGTL